VFGIGEHHRAEFLDSAPVVILSAAAARTENIRLTSAVTFLAPPTPFVFFRVLRLSTSSPGAAPKSSLVVFLIESYPPSVCVLRLRLALCRKTRSSSENPGKHASCTGRENTAPALTGKQSTLAPLQDPLPIWVGVGGTPNPSFAPASLDFSYGCHHRGEPNASAHS